MKFFSVSCDFKAGELNVDLLFDGETDSDESKSIFLAKSRYETLSGRVNSGTKDSYDAASNSSIKPILYSENFFEVLRSIQATGYFSTPVELFTSKGTKINGFSALCITGRSGAFDYSKSIPTMNAPRFPGGHEYFGFKGSYFEEVSWDGSDVFVPAGTYFSVVTERVATALTKAKLKNVSIIALDEQVADLTDDKIIDAFGKQKFSEWKLQKLI